MNHLEKLIRQYYEWQGYVVRGNVKVGKLSHGGWAGELDIVAYNPETKHLVHLEPSIDAHPWPKREERFRKKFRSGKKFIYKEVFPWLSAKTVIDQIAVLITSSRSKVGGGKVISIDDFMKEVKGKILKKGVMSKNAIPEEYDLLRTLQMALCGYRKSP